MRLGGRRDLGGGGCMLCDPTFELWLEGGAVTHIVSNFSCTAIC